MNQSGSLSSMSSDVLLWQRFKEGDHAAFEQMIALYYTTLFRFGTRFTHDAELVKDCLQEMFIYLWEKRSAIGTTDSIRKYLFKSFRHKMLLELQRLNRREWVSADDMLNTLTERNFQETLFSIEKEQFTSVKIKQAINQLPIRQQEALYLRYYEGLDVDQIAQIMTINRQSVSNHLYKALTYLRDHLDGFTISMLVCVFGSFN